MGESGSSIGEKYPVELKRSPNLDIVGHAKAARLGLLIREEVLTVDGSVRFRRDAKHEEEAVEWRYRLTWEGWDITSDSSIV